MNYLQQFRQRHSEYNDLSDQEVLDGLYRNHYSDLERSDFDTRMAGEVPIPDDEGEINFGTALDVGTDILQRGYYSAAEGLGESFDVDFLKKYGREGVAQQKEDLAESTGLQQFREIDSIGDTVEFAVEQIGQQLPIMAPMLAGSLAGGKVGAMIGAAGANPITVGAGAIIGGIAGGALASIPLFYGQNRERQKEVSGSVQSEGAAFLTAIPQAAAESVISAVTLGVGKVGAPAITNLLYSGGGVFTRAARGFGGGALVEVPTEIGQQALERMQAGLEVFSEDAELEYIDAAAAALFVGGAFGTAGNVAFGNRQTLAEMRAEADDAALRADLETLLANESVEVDDLTDQEIMEFAEKNRENDPLFAYIVDSGLAEATKIKTLRRRMSEVFTGVLSENQIQDPLQADGYNPLQIAKDQADRRGPALGTFQDVDTDGTIREETVVANRGTDPATLLLSDEETIQVAAQYAERYPEINEILKAEVEPKIKVRLLRRKLRELIPATEATGTGTAEIRAGDFSTELQEERGGIAPGAEGAPRLADRTGQPAERGALLEQEQADQAIAEDILARGEQEREDSQRRTTETLEAASATVSPTSELTDQQFETGQTLEAAGRVLRGEQASTLGPEAVATVEGERGNVPTFRAVQDARERVNGLLDKLEGVGSGGIEAARAVRERIEQRNLTGDQALGMLRGAEAFAETLPVDAKNVQLRFLDKVMLGAAAAEASGGGATAQEGPGRRLSTGNGLDGIVEISLGEPSSVIRSTAAHEAFHVMQDVYADVDPGAANILNRAFGRPNETKRLKDLPSGIIRMLKKAEFAPGASFWKELTANESKNAAPIQSGELQAYSYQAYNLLKSQGKKVPGLGGAMSRYMIFNRKFFQRLGNSLRGDGFRTATEVFAEVPQTARQRADGGVQTTTGSRVTRPTPQPVVTPRPTATPRPVATPRPTASRVEPTPVLTPEEVVDLDRPETQGAANPVSDFAQVLSGEITPAEFQQAQQAIGLQMSGIGQLSRDTGREFARADFWGVPLEDGGFQILPGVAQRGAVAIHLANDGDVGRQAYNGLFDIRQAPDNRFNVIVPGRAEVDRQGNVTVTEKGKVALPDWSLVADPDEREFEQASVLDRLARRATGVEQVQDGNVTRRFGMRDVPDLIRQRMDAGLPTQEITSLLEDTDVTSEQASALALRGMRELEPRLEEFNGFDQTEYSFEIDQPFSFDLDIAGTEDSTQVQHDFQMRLSRNPNQKWKDTYVAFTIDGSYSQQRDNDIEYLASRISTAADRGDFEKAVDEVGRLTRRAAEKNYVDPTVNSPEFEAFRDFVSDDKSTRDKKVDDLKNLLLQQQRITKKHNTRVASELFPLASAMVARHIREDRPNILQFSSSSKTGSRSRIYHKAGQKIADEYGYEVRTFYDDESKRHAHQYILSPETAVQLDAFTNGLPEFLGMTENDKNVFSESPIVSTFLSDVLPNVVREGADGINKFAQNIKEIVEDSLGIDLVTDRLGTLDASAVRQIADLFGLTATSKDLTVEERRNEDADQSALDRLRRSLFSDDGGITEQASTLALTMERLDQRIPQADRVASPNPRAPLTANSFTSILGGNGSGFNGNQADINRIFEESIAETDDDGGTTARDAVKAVKMRAPSADFWNKAFKMPNRVRYWYEASAEAFRDLTNFRSPEALSRFIDIVSGTSGGVEPYPNLMRAMGVASEDAQGIPIRTDLRDPASATKALAPSDLNTLKFGNFAGTMQFINGLTPKAPLSTNDTQVASAFGFPGTALASKPILYEVLSRFYQKLRDVQNSGIAAGEQPYESWQIQALGWVEERGRKKETKQNVSDDYGEALPKIISTLQANGVPVPNGQITETTLQDARVPNLMSGTRRYFDQGRFATVETASELTPEGKRAAEIYEYLRGREEIPWVRDAKKKYVRQQRIPMEKLARRKASGKINPKTKKAYGADPSLLSNIMSELVGTKVEVSRVDPRNFTGWGTFESVMSPNLRIPMQFRVMETQGFASLTPVARRALLAMLGKALGQKAMAASQFTPAADPANPDTFRVFVQTTDPANFNPTVIETFEKDAGGFPLNIEEVPNGYTIDLNIGGFDVGPNLQTVQDAVTKNLGNQDATIVLMDYASDYIEENGYVDANGDFQTVNGYDSFINELLEQDDASQSRDDSRGVGRGNRVEARSLRANLTRYAAQLEEIAAARDGGFREWSDGVEGLLSKERRKEDERRAKQARISTKDTLNAAKAARKQMRTTGEQASVLSISTPAFKNWFQQSKVVDDQGNPLVVYHGSRSDIESFDPTVVEGNQGEFGQVGMYFTEDPDYAQTYAMFAGLTQSNRGRAAAGQTIYPVYLSIQNPLVIKNPTFWESVKQRIRDRNKSRTERQLDEMDIRGKTALITKARRDELEAQGYDGIINERANEIIAFRPTQIKSVFNQGTYDPQDARVQASTLGRTDFRGGGRRAPDEIILTAAELYESGLSLRAVSKELADRGLVNPKTGQPYSPMGIQKLLDSVGTESRTWDDAVPRRNVKFKKPFSLEGRKTKKINVDAYKEIRRLAEQDVGVRQISNELAKQPEKYRNSRGGSYNPAMVARIINDELARDGAPSEQASTLGYNPIFAAGAQPRPIKSILSKLIPTSLKEFRQQMVNGFDPLADLEMRVNSGKLRDATRSAFKMAELSLQLTGRTESFLLNGPPVFNQETGGVSANTEIGGLKDIFEPIGAGEKYLRFQDYAYARRADELINDPMAQEIINPTTGKVSYPALDAARAELAQSTNFINRLKEQPRSPERDKNIRDFSVENQRFKNQVKRVEKSIEVKKNLEESFPAELRQQALALGNPEFDQVLDRYKAFNDSMLQYLVDTGLISEAQRDGMARTSLYVPFYKLADEDSKEMNSDVLGPKLRSGLSNPDAGIKALTGEGGQIGDLYENVIRNAQVFLGAGLRNEAMRRSVDLMGEAEIGGVQREKGPTTVTYKVGGQDRHYNIAKPNATGQIDPDAPALFTALTSFSRPQTEGIVRAMETVANIFRSGITISPGFMVANFIRGDLAGAVTTDGNLRPLIDSAIGLKAALTNNQSVQDLKQQSGVGGYAFGGRPKGFANQLKRDFRKGEEVVGVTTKMSDVLANLWGRAEAVGEATELATREAIFRRLQEAGFNDVEAAYQALALVNYSRRGNPDSLAATALAQIIPLVPFLNARVQGLYRTASAVSGKEANAKGTILKGMALTGASMALYALSSGDERWKEEPIERKLNYYIFYPTKDTKILIPKPFEVGAIFSTIPEFFTDLVMGNITGKDAARAAKMTVLNTFGFNPAPQAVLPIFEVIANYDFFTDRALETAGVQRLPSGDRAYSTTSQTAAAFGQATGLSPIKFEQIIKGYLGSMGSLGLSAVDSVLSATGAVPAKPAGIFENEFADGASFLTGLTRFVKESPDSANKFVGDFYELKREVDEIYAAVQDRRKNGEVEAALDLMRENRKKLGARSSLNSMQKTMSTLNREIQRVKRTERMDSNQKKQRLQRLINQRNRVAGQTERILERIN